MQAGKTDFETYLASIRKIAEEEGYDSLDDTYVEHLRARYYEEDVVIGQGARVVLREMKPSDLEVMYRFWKDSEESVLKAFIKETKEASEQYLKAYIRQMYPLYDHGIWTVELSGSKEVVGFCGLGRLEIAGEEYTDLGYYIAPKYRQQGLASESIEIVLDYAKNYLELSEVYAKAEKENQISRKILKKYGFEPLEFEKDIFLKVFRCSEKAVEFA